MLDTNESILTRCIIHQVGNKVLNRDLKLSDSIIPLDEIISNRLKEYLFKGVKDQLTTYKFTHDVNINHNSVYSLCDLLMSSEQSFADTSKKLGTYLYNQTRHPGIKNGQLFVTKYEDIVFENKICSAIGIFKLESPNDFFQLEETSKGLSLSLQPGFGYQKIDKSCLVLNIDYHDGFIVLCNEGNSGDTEYWRRDFLNIIPLEDKYKHTSDLIKLCSVFSDEHILNTYGKQDQVNFLDQTLSVMQEEESISFETFTKRVLKDKVDRDTFKRFKTTFEDQNMLSLPDDIEIAPKVVLREKKRLKKEINLDTSISIKLNGQDISYPQQYIEKGFDSKRGMNYYKVFFNTES